MPGKQARHTAMTVITPIASLNTILNTSLIELGAGKAGFRRSVASVGRGGEEVSISTSWLSVLRKWRWAKGLLTMAKNMMRAEPRMKMPAPKNKFTDTMSP
jgi:hypothetical protein